MAMLPTETPRKTDVRVGYDHLAYQVCWRYALIIFLLALGYRAVYLLELSRQPAYNVFYMDEEYHVGWAKAMASGKWNPPYDQLRSAPYFRAPLYPYFLAGMLRVFGENYTIVRIVQIIIGAISCALAYAVATKCFAQRVGVITGVLCALYWVLAYFDGELLLPVLEVFFALLGFLLAFVAAERRNAILAGLAGLAFGLFAITRPNILAFYPFVIWWAVRVSRDSAPKRSWAFAALLAAGCILPPALVTVRNRVVGGDWAVVASQGGVNFYIGNNPRSNGMQAVVPGTRETWWGGYEDTVAIANKAAGRPLKPSEVSSYWFNRGFAYIREQPGSWARLMFRKTVAMVGNVEVPNNEPYEARRGRFWTLAFVPLSFGLVLALFVLALPQMLASSPTADRRVDANARMRRKFARLLLQFLAIYAFSVIAFFVTGRYRVPLIPFVMMGAALTIARLAALVRSRQLMPFLGWLGAATVLVVLLQADYLHVRHATTGFAELTEAQDLLAAGDVDRAIAGLEAIRARRSVTAPEAYTTLVRAYVRRNRPADREAIAAVVQDGLAQYPNEPELLWYAAMGHAEAGRMRELEQVLLRYRAQKPDDLRAIYLAFHAAIELGKTGDARNLLLQAERVRPGDPLVARMRSEAAGLGLGH